MIRRAAPIVVLVAGLAACTRLSPPPSKAPHAPAIAAKPSASPVIGPSSPSAVSSPVAGDILLAPKGASTEFAGRIALDAAYAVGSGAAKVLSDAGGGLIANNGGSLIANNSGNLVGRDPSQILSHQGAGLTPGVKLLSDHGGGLISNNGSGLTGASQRRLLAAASAREAVPVAGMLVGVQSLLDGAYLPLGVDGQGKLVYAVYTDAKGEFKVHLPPDLAPNNLLVVASVPGTQDTRLAVNLLTKPVGASDLRVDDGSTVITSYLRTVLSNRIAEILAPDPCRPPLVLTTGSADFLSLSLEPYQDLFKGADFLALPRLSQQRVILRHADAVISLIDLEKLMIDPALEPRSTASGPALATFNRIIAQLEGAAAERLAELPTYFDYVIYVKLANLAHPGRPPIQIRKPSDLTEFAVDEYLSSNDPVIVRREETVMVDLGLPVSLHTDLRAFGRSVAAGFLPILDGDVSGRVLRETIAAAVADEVKDGHPSPDPPCAPTPAPPQHEAEVTTLAGNGTAGFLDGPGATALFRYPARLVVDPSGFLLVSEALGARIRKIDLNDPAHPVTTVAGSGTSGFGDGPAATAQFGRPEGLVLDGHGTLYVADSTGARIRKIVDCLSDHAVVSTLAGSGLAGFADGAGAAAQFNEPEDLCAGPDGSLYVADTTNNRVRKLMPDGTVTTLAGNGGTDTVNGFGLAAGLSGPQGIAFAPAGYLLVSDGRIRKVTLVGGVTIHAGLNGSVATDGTYHTATFLGPHALAFGPAGDAYVADAKSHAIRMLDPQGYVLTVAGGGTSGFADGHGKAALFARPEGVAVGPDGTVYVADSLNNRIRALSFK